MDMSVSWSPPAEGCDIDEQFAEMNIALGRLAQTGETLRRQHNEMEVRTTGFLRHPLQPALRHAMATASTTDGARSNSIAVDICQVLCRRD